MPDISRVSKWKVVDSRYVIKDRWIKIRADECRTLEKVDIKPYYVFEFPDWVHMVALDDRDRILVTRQYRHGIRKVVVEIPCGIVKKPTDKSPLAAAKREFREETGYEGEFTLAGKFSPNPANHTNMVYTYLVSGARQVCSPQENRLERIESELIPLPELIRLIEKKSFLQTMHICSIVLALKNAGRLSKFASLWENASRDLSF